MTKAENDPITGERVVAPDSQAAGHGYQNAPGLTSGAAGGQSRKAAGEIITAGHAIALKTETAEQDCLRPVPDLTSGATGRDTPKAELGDRARLETATLDADPAGRASKHPSGLTNSSDWDSALEAGSKNAHRADFVTSQIAPETAAAAVASTAPSILELGKHLAQVEISYNAHDVVELNRTLRGGDEDGLRHAKNQAEAAQLILGDRQEALRDLICTMPAKTLADAAIQVAAIVVISARLSASHHTAHQVTREADKIERMALGMLPILAAASGLDMEAMDWADNDQLRPLRFTGVEVQS